MKELINWTEALDYDNYVKEWFSISTSNMSNNFRASCGVFNNNQIRFLEHYRRYLF